MVIGTLTGEMISTVRPASDSVPVFDDDEGSSNSSASSSTLNFLRSKVCCKAEFFCTVADLRGKVVALGSVMSKAGAGPDCDCPPELDLLLLESLSQPGSDSPDSLSDFLGEFAGETTFEDCSVA